MRPTRPPRWTGLLVLPLLVGALLLMHGLDARVHTGSHPAGSAAAGHADEAAQPAHGDEHCPTCAAGHIMVACVAIVTAVAGLVFLRRALSRAVRAVAATTSAGIRALDQVLRPPEPAWVRLAVMRC